MPYSVSFEEKENRLKIQWDAAWKGLDSKSPPTRLVEDHLPDLQNVNLPSGVAERQDGSTIHATDMVLPGADEGSLLARYIPASGTASYIGAGKDGHVYRWTGTAWTSLRRGLDTSSTKWWSKTAIGDYLVISNELDGAYKYDGTRLNPLGAKYISDAEAAEESTWTGGTADTTDIRQGLQSRALVEANANGTESMDLQPATAWDLINGLLLARDYNTTTDRISFYVHITNLTNIDTTNTYIRFGDAADTAYFQAAASLWGTLAAGWNLVRIARSSFTTTGAPVWSNIAKMTLFLDTNAGGGATLKLDDVYVMYDAASTFPAVQTLATWKNMILGGKTTTEPSEFYFTKVSGPDEFNSSAILPVDANDGTELTGLHPFYNQVCITKENSVHSLSGTVAGTVYPNYNFELIRVSTEHGCSSHRSIVEAGGYLYMWWRGELHRYRGTGTEKVSTRIDPTLATVQDAARLEFVVGARKRALNQIMWWYSHGSDTTNVRSLKYDYVEQAFIPQVGQTMALAEQVFEGDVEYLLTVGYTGRVLRQDSGTAFDGSSITAFITLPWTSAQRQGEMKTWDMFEVPHQTNTGSLVVEYRIANHPREFDAASYTTAGTIDMAVAGELGRIFIGERSRWIQVRLRTVGAPFILYTPFTLWAIPLGWSF